MRERLFFEKLYERQPEGWGVSWRRTQLRKYEIYLEMISKMSPTPEIILDIGCGEGFFTSQLGRQVTPNVIGMDLSSVAVERARLRYPHLQFHQCSVTDLAWNLIAQDKGLDLIVMGAVLAYLSPAERQQCIFDIWSHMKEGAHLLVSDNIDSGPYFPSRRALLDYFEGFEPVEERGLCIRSYYRYIESPLWALHTRVMRWPLVDRLVMGCLRYMPIRTIESLSRRLSEAEELVYIVLFRKKNHAMRLATATEIHEDAPLLRV
ncbi:MAG: class I SAM-dependent methyltransferase [Terriglobia bacterium]